MPKTPLRTLPRWFRLCTAVDPRLSDGGRTVRSLLRALDGMDWPASVAHAVCLPEVSMARRFEEQLEVRQYLEGRCVSPRLRGSVIPRQVSLG